MNKAFYQFFISFAGAFVCLYLAFSPAVNVPYTNHDSIRYFHKFYNKESDSKVNPLYGDLKADGRFVSAEFEELLYKNIDHLSDISRLRVITIAILALSISLLTIAVQAGGMGFIPAFCLSTVIFTLPGAQDIIFVPYPYVALAIFLSLLGYFILTINLVPALSFILTIILLEAVFFMYPPATFFFLIPAMFLLIFGNDWPAIKKGWGRDILLWLLTAVIFYFIMKVFLYPQVKSSHHEIAFTLKQLMFNIMTFFSQGLPQVFNLWNVYYSKTLGIFMIIFTAIFLAIDLIFTKRLGVKRLFLLAIIFFVFNMIWFLFGGYMPRQFMAAQALALVLVYWCGDWLGRTARIWPASFLCIGLIIANQMITSNVLNNYSELMFMRSRLVQLVNSSTKEIHVILLKDWNRGYNGLPRVYDNINDSVPNYEVPDLIRVALKDLSDPFELHCIVTYSQYGEPFSTMPNSVVIDMNDLVYISSPERR